MSNDNDERRLAAAHRTATEYFEWKAAASRPSRHPSLHDERIMFVSLVREALEREARAVEAATMHAMVTAQLPYRVVAADGAGDHEGLHYSVVANGEPTIAARFRTPASAQALCDWLNHSKPKYGGGQ